MITRPLRRKKPFRQKNQENIYNQHHKTLIELLKKATSGITREELHLKTGLSRRIITKHIRDLGDNVRRENRQLFWAPYYERYEELRKTIDNVSRIILRIGLDPKYFLENYGLVIFPNSSHMYFFSVEDKQLMQMLSRRAMYVGKVTRIHPKLPKSDLVVMDDIWMEEGIV